MQYIRLDTDFIFIRLPLCLHQYFLLTTQYRAIRIKYFIKDSGLVFESFYGLADIVSYNSGNIYMPYSDTSLSWWLRHSGSFTHPMFVAPLKRASACLLLCFGDSIFVAPVRLALLCMCCGVHLGRLLLEQPPTDDKNGYGMATRPNSNKMRCLVLSIWHIFLSVFFIRISYTNWHRMTWQKCFRCCPRLLRNYLPANMELYVQRVTTIFMITETRYF